MLLQNPPGDSAAYLVVAVEPLQLEERRVGELFDEVVGPGATLVLHDRPPRDGEELL